MAYYVVRAVSTSAAVNTYVNMTNDGTGTNVGAIQVPVGVSLIAQIIFSVAASTWTVTSVGGNFHLRLSGNGLTDGQQELTVGSIGAITTTSGSQVSFGATVLSCAIRVIVGNTITPAVAQSGVSIGTRENSVTLVFQ